MILVISKQGLELTTEEVIDWLKYYDAPFVRISANEFYRDVKYKDFQVSVKNIPIDNIRSCWFRRWKEDKYLMDIIGDSKLSGDNLLELGANIRNELLTVDRVFWKSLDQKNWLTHPKELVVNKIDVLQKARDAGLMTPDTIITTEKEDLILFREKQGRVITKSLGDGAFFFDNDLKAKTTIAYTLKTIEITDEIIDKCPDHFFPSLFQSLVEKEYEIRSFFLNGQLYSMAIFSQLDSRTRIDFRNYNTEKPIRYVPYRLPDDITEKIYDLMLVMKMTTGSIDIIKSKNGDYLFLEINPVGQFGMVSTPCNYYLEKEVAKLLIKNDEEQ